MTEKLIKYLNMYWYMCVYRLNFVTKMLVVSRWNHTRAVFRTYHSAANRTQNPAVSSRDCQQITCLAARC
jgi:predicted transglutaminase-like protease